MKTKQTKKVSAKGRDTKRVKRQCRKCGGNRGMRGRYPPTDGLCVECRG